jgi:Anthrone oxygenase
MARPLTHLSAVLLGLLSGAMLLIAVSFVPLWRSMPPAEFRNWFSANSFSFGALMFPLGTASAVSSVAAWMFSQGKTMRGWLLFSMLSAQGVVLITLAINEPANRLFAEPGVLNDAETSALLTRWIVWHWIRLLFGMGAFYAAVSGIAEEPHGVVPARAPSPKL